jgi:DNA-binding NtrC family response regulator
MSSERKSIRVLVVDDEPQVCQSVEKILKRKGYSVEHALCVSNALDMLEKEEQLDLIIADLMMPQAGGMELLKTTKDRWPNIPVLIITGYASIASAVEATQLGAAGYIPKPFTPEELETAVHSVVVKGPWQEQKPAEKDAGKVIDVDIPFNPAEVAKATSAEYVEHLTRSDMPLVHPAPKAAQSDFCPLGNRACKRVRTKGVCKQAECPIVVAERKKAARVAAVGPLVSDPIDVDLPFSAREVAAATSEDYVAALGRDGMPNFGYRSAKKPAARRILVVDDEVVVVNSIRKTLLRKGYVVDEAFTGTAALTRIFAQKYDLVLLDMRMPDLNGLDLLPKIKRHRPDLPVVMVTGYASIDTAVEAIRRGASEYLAKPFSPDELYQTTDKILKRPAA